MPQNITLSYETLVWLWFLEKEHVQLEQNERSHLYQMTETIALILKLMDGPYDIEGGGGEVVLGEVKEI